MHARLLQAEELFHKCPHLRVCIHGIVDFPGSLKLLQCSRFCELNLQIHGHVIRVHIGGPLS